MMLLIPKDWEVKNLSKLTGVCESHEFLQYIGIQRKEETE